MENHRRNLMQRAALLAAGAIMAVLAVTLCARTLQTLPRQIPIGDSCALRVSVRGCEGPVVIMEALGATPLEQWARLQKELSRTCVAVAYEHAGYWGSTDGTLPRDARQIARELRTALRVLELDPPYFLVGYSFGGPYARVFADLYPEDVGGLTLLDPTQEEFITWLESRFPEFLPRPRAAHPEASESTYWRDSLQQAQDSILPVVPVILVTGARGHDPFTRRYLPVWTRTHADWIARAPGREHRVTWKSGHDIPFREPELALEAILDVVARAKSQEGQP